MFELNPSVVNQYVFNNNNGTMIGGFPISEYIKYENSKQRMLGGGKPDPIGLSKFDGLTIPIGLVSYSNQIQTGGNKYDKNKTNGIHVINDNEFDKMLNTVAKIKENKMFTRKKR